MLSNELKKSLIECLKELRLSTVRTCYEEEAGRARREDLAYEYYLAEVMEREREVRRHNRVQRLLRESKLPLEKSFDVFEKDRLPSMLTAQVNALIEGSFLDRSENVLAFGNPGSGKTHLLCAIGQELILQGRRVLFSSCSLLVQQLLIAKRDLNLPRLLKRLRTYAMVHLAYTMALRPVEISRIILNDISFSEKTLTIPERKGDRPITLPIPEKTMKAMAVYILHARIKTQHRHLFMTHKRPYCPLSSGSVCAEIWRAMKNAGLSSSAYWLRHTHAQNLLAMGRSIYEIKEMLGHQDIQHTQRYLHIDTELMRKVLLNETL